MIKYCTIVKFVYNKLYIILFSILLRFIFTVIQSKREILQLYYITQTVLRKKK
jgi:hypothetical protein